MKEIIEKYYKETIKTINGAKEQGFTGEELFQVLLEENEKTKEKLLAEIKD